MQGYRRGNWMATVNLSLYDIRLAYNAPASEERELS